MIDLLKSTFTPFLFIQMVCLMYGLQFLVTCVMDLFNPLTPFLLMNVRLYCSFAVYGVASSWSALASVSTVTTQGSERQGV